MNKHIIVMTFIFFGVVAAAYASPYDRGIFSIGSGDHRWGVYEWVDVPTGDPFKPMCNVVVLGLGPNRSWKILSYSGSVVSRFVVVHLVIFAIIFILVSVYGIGRRWTRFKFLKLTAVFLASASILGLCYLSFWIGGGRLRYATLDSDSHLLSSEWRHIRKDLRALELQSTGEIDTLASSNITDIYDSLRRAARILGSNKFNGYDFRGLWGDLIRIEHDATMKNLLENDQRSEGILNLVNKIKTYIKQQFPQDALSWTLEIISDHPEAINFHASDLPSVQELVSQKRLWHPHVYIKTCVPQEKTGLLHEMLQDKKYQQHWPNVALVLSIISEDANSLPLIVEYVKRPDISIFVSTKLKPLMYLGRFKSPLAKEVLLAASTKDGAKELCKAWIDQISYDKEWINSPHDVIRFSQEMAIRGLPYLDNEESDNRLIEIYETFKYGILTGEVPNVPLSTISQAMGIKDFVKDYGAEQAYFYLGNRTRNNPRTQYLDKYDFSEDIRQVISAADANDHAVVFRGARPSTWEGRWEDGTGYWLQISIEDGEFRLERSGSGSTLKVLSMSPDSRTLKYDESGCYLRTLVLRSENVATDECYDVHEDKMWKCGVL